MGRGEEGKRAKARGDGEGVREGNELARGERVHLFECATSAVATEGRRWTRLFYEPCAWLFYEPCACFTLAHLTSPHLTLRRASSPPQDERLRHLVNTHGGKEWKKISVR